MSNVGVSEVFTSIMCYMCLQSMKGKSKSSHDLLDDERLSSVPAVDTRKRKHDDDEDEAARVTTFV